MWFSNRAGSWLLRKEAELISRCSVGCRTNCSSCMMLQAQAGPGGVSLTCQAAHRHTEQAGAAVGAHLTGWMKWGLCSCSA